MAKSKIQRIPYELMRLVDVVFRGIFRKLSVQLYRKITGDLDDEFEILDPKFRTIQSYEADILFLSKKSGTPVQVEVQSKNELVMPARLGIYAFQILLKFGKLPKQYVIYVGTEPLNMPSKVTNIDGSITLEIVYIQPKLEWDAKEFLESNEPELIIWSLFCGGMSDDDLVKAVFNRIVSLNLSPKEKNKYFRFVELATNNTPLQPLVRAQMNIFGLPIDITSDRLYRKGEEVGIEQGIGIGKKEGIGIGKEQGKKEGIGIGKEQGRAESAIALMETLALTKEQAIKALKLTSKEIKAFEALLKVEIE